MRQTEETRVRPSDAPLLRSHCLFPKSGRIRMISYGISPFTPSTAWHLTSCFQPESTNKCHKDFHCGIEGWNRGVREIGEEREGLERRMEIERGKSKGREGLEVSRGRWENQSHLLTTINSHHKPTKRQKYWLSPISVSPVITQLHHVVPGVYSLLYRHQFNQLQIN